MVRRHAFLGAFAHPKYGGNAGAIGWRFLAERFRDPSGASAFGWEKAIEPPLGASTDYRLRRTGMAEEFDVVVIGSGAGGAPIAYELAGSNARILILEKGPAAAHRRRRSGVSPQRLQTRRTVQRRPREADQHPRRRQYGTVLLFEPRRARSQRRAAPVVESQRAGSPRDDRRLHGAGRRRRHAALRRGVARFAERDFQLRAARLSNLPSDPCADPDVDIRDWPYLYADLLPYYEKAETLVGINGTVNDVVGGTPAQLKPFPRNCYQAPLSANPISQFALDGMKGMGAPVYRTPLAVITEAHAPSGRPAPVWVKTGFVNRYGDPLGYKSNTWVALLRPAMRQKPGRIELRCNCTVTHLQSDGARVTAVHYRDPSGFARTAVGRLVVVACSAIESVRLLMLSAEGSGRIRHPRPLSDRRYLARTLLPDALLRGRRGQRSRRPPLRQDAVARQRLRDRLVRPA